MQAVDLCWLVFAFKHVGKDLSELAGYTHRVSMLLKVLTDLNENHYELSSDITTKPIYDINDVKGIVEFGHDGFPCLILGIRFKNVPITTPAGDTVLLKDLSLIIQPNDHLMITGLNGSGKSSILRVLANIWPVFSGILQRPAASISDIMYIPQVSESNPATISEHGNASRPNHLSARCSRHATR